MLKIYYNSYNKYKMNRRQSRSAQNRGSVAVYRRQPVRQIQTDRDRLLQKITGGDSALGELISQTIPNLPGVTYNLSGASGLSKKESRDRASSALRGKTSIIKTLGSGGLKEELVALQVRKDPGASTADQVAGGFKEGGSIISTISSIFGGIAAGATALGQPEIALPAGVIAAGAGGAGIGLGIIGSGIEGLYPKGAPFKPVTQDELMGIAENTDRFLMNVEAKRNKFLQDDQRAFIADPTSDPVGIGSINDIEKEIEAFTADSNLRHELLRAFLDKIREDVEQMRKDTKISLDAGLVPPPVGTIGGVPMTAGNVAQRADVQPGTVTSTGDKKNVLATQSGGNIPPIYYEKPKGNDLVFDDEKARERQSEFLGIITTFSNQTQQLLDQEDNPYIREQLIADAGDWDQIEYMKPFRKEMWDRALGMMYGDIEQATRARIMSTFVPGLNSCYVKDGMGKESIPDDDISVNELFILGADDLGRLGTIPQIGQTTSMDNAMTVGSSNTMSTLSGSTPGVEQGKGIVGRMEDSLYFIDNSSTVLRNGTRPLLTLDKPSNWDDGSDDPRLKIIRKTDRKLRTDYSRPKRPVFGDGVFDEERYGDPQSLPASIAAIRGDPRAPDVATPTKRVNQVVKVRNSNATHIRSLNELLPMI